MLQEFLLWLEALPAAVAISESAWLFPGIEVLHVLAVTLVVGSITMVDLRLLGLTLRERAAAELIREVLPFTWMSFAVAALSGAALFSSAATRYWGTVPFRLKMLLLALAGLNMAAFHFSAAYRSVDSWDRDGDTPPRAKMAGGLSLALWIGVVGAGRWIGFV